MLALVALPLLAAACVGPDYAGPVRTDTTPSQAFQPGMRLDTERGIWGTQPIVPPPGLVTVRQGDLIGRTASDGSGNDILVINYLLADPMTGDARYAVGSSNTLNSGDYVIVPLSVLRVSGGSVSIDATERQLNLVPKYSQLDLERRYPMRTLTSVVLPPPLYVAPGLSPAPIATGLPPVVAPGEPLQLVRRGSVVGYPVVDSFGQPIGTVDAVATVPATGEVRYAIVSSPMLGLGNYIAVPSASTRADAGRVTVAGASATWLQQPRYRGDQVQQIFGPLGVVN